MNNKENNSKKLLLIDGNGLAYRAFYALPSRKTRLGFPVNALLGSISLLLNAVLSERPTHIAAAFDHGAFVDTLMKFQSFNVQREEMLADLDVQLPLVEDFMHVCGIKAFRMPGFEADDCIGTLAAKAVREGYEVLIISGDLRLLQLVAPHVRVMTMRRGIVDTVIFDEAMVKSKYGLRPSQLADLRALAGDSSQNIGGVPGIGEVTAHRLLSQYSSLADLFDSLDQLPAKWRNPLAENCDDAFEFLARSTIRCDLPIEADMDSLRFDGFPAKQLDRIFARVKIDGGNTFTKGFARMPLENEPPARLPEAPLYGEEALKALEACRDSSEPISFVWLKNDRKSRKWGLCVCLDGGDPFYLDLTSWDVPEGEDYSGENAGVLEYAKPAGGEGEESPEFEGTAPSSEDVWAVLRPIFDDPNRVKYVCGVDELIEQSISFANVYDIYLMSSLLDISVTNHFIEAIFARHGLAVYNRLMLFGINRDVSTADTAGRMYWSCRVAILMGELGRRMRRRMEDRGLENLYREVELPLGAAMCRLNKMGLRCDQELVRKVVDLTDAELDRMRRDFFAEAGKEFDLDSEEQLSNYLFNDLALLVPTRSKDGPVLSADMLKSLQEQNPIVGKIRCYCELSEFRRTFVQKFMLDGDVYVDVGTHLFNLAIVRERRLQLLGRVGAQGCVELMEHMLAVVSSLASPGLRRPLTKAIDGFLRPSGVSRLIYIYFPFMALRVLSHLAKDETLKKDLDDKKDVELELLRAVFEGELGEIVAARQLIVQMLFFRFSTAWMARRLNLEGEDGLKQAEEYLRKFDQVLAARYPVSWDFMLSCQSSASAMEYLSTIAGRSCEFAEAGSRNYSVRENAERAARSFCVEGSCTDIIRKALVEIYRVFGSCVCAMPCSNMIIINAPEGREDEIAEKCRQICLESSYGIDLEASFRIY